MPAEQVNEEELLEKLRRHEQEHMIDWLERLDQPERERLAAQLAGLDFQRLEELRSLIGTPPTEIDFDEVEPAPVAELPETSQERAREEQVAERGRQALRDGRVAAVTVAGGQGTRLGYDHPKGMYPISPLRRKSLFQLFAEQILASRRRYGCALPWLIMTSPINNAETVDFFEDNDYFGLGADSVHFFIQRQNPILDEEGRLLLAERDELLMGPDGHGGTFDALEHAGLLEMLRTQGHDLISYFQVDNPLVTAADPRFLGHHLQQEADFSCKVIPKRDPAEGLGLAVLEGGRPAVIEYIDVPEGVATARGPDGRLEFLYGSIAIHIIDVGFAERVVNRPGGLPWHVAQKTYEIVDREGRKAESPSKGCRKFERFIFDALQFAEQCAFVEVRRETEFAPVKNAEGQDSPATCRRQLQQMWLEWVEQADGPVDVDLSEPVVEISPLYALDAGQLAHRTPEDWRPEFPLVLEEGSEG